MTKDDKYIIAYSIGLGFFLTLLGLFALARLIAPGYIIDPGSLDLVFFTLTGAGGITVCVYGIHKHTKKHKATKDEQGRE